MQTDSSDDDRQRVRYYYYSSVRVIIRGGESRGFNRKMSKNPNRLLSLTGIHGLCFLLFNLILIANNHHRALAVKREDFKTCDQSSFCKRHRALPPGESKYSVGNVKYENQQLTAELIYKNNPKKLSLLLQGVQDSRLRLKIDEIDGLRPRFDPSKDALAGDPPIQRFKSHTAGSGSSMLMTQDGNKVILHYRPFRLDVYSGNKDLVLSINSQGLLKYEYFRLKKEQQPSDEGTKSDEEGDEENVQLDSESTGANANDTDNQGGDEGGEEDGEGFWDENFRSHQDSKPYGSSSVGMDLAFVGFNHIYGIPEHADDFALKSTAHSDPYRLYNLDVFEYELRNPMALYGSIPYVVAHSAQRTVGVLWLNAAETWVDVRPSTADKGYLSSLVDKFRSSTETPQVDTHWISESGLIDIYIFLGPKPVDVFRQFSALTGVSEIPPQFAQAYHQCRWNYNDEEDVRNVNHGFDEHDIPMDLIWLDIEHTDGKKYFTWDPTKFPNPTQMINDVAARGRKMVTIIDPHIKKDDNYKIYKEAKDLDLFVKNRDGNELDGWCWPGASAYLDFLKPDVKDYWAKHFALNMYEGSTEDLFVWNDMNEPSVFNGPEITMHKDCKHFGGWEHRDVHNMYGFYHHQATVKGLLDRSGGQKRPFVLTRAFFVGSQRYSSVWTGDNTATWEHLAISIPMLLSLSVAGIPFVGADVGGFFGNPDEELLARWYQMGAFSPFFRAHAHLDTRRREPWLFSDRTKSVIRDAIRYRYRLLPFWYTVFQEHSVTGLPVMRPMWLEYPDDPLTFDEEKQFMIGDALCIRPVFEPGAQSTSIYLPGEQSMWYNFDTLEGRPGPGALYVDTPLEKFPVFMRGGKILVTRERVRRSSKLMAKDPITLYVANNFHGDFANGSLYMDDGESYEYRKGQFIHRKFELRAEGQTLLTLESLNANPSGVMKSSVTIERIVIMGMKFHATKVHLLYEDYKAQPLEFTWDQKSRSLHIRKPNVPVNKDWRIDIHAF